MSHPITLEALEVLDAIDRKGSFAAAADSLYRVPSAITYTINKLEEQLNVVLFRKEGRRSLLTPTGRVLLEQGRELLEAAERLAETARQVETGWESRLSISVDSLLSMESVYPLLREFYHEVDQQVEVSMHEDVLGGIWEAVQSGAADLAIGAADPVPASGNISTQPLCDIDWLFAVAPSHPLAQVEYIADASLIENYRAVVVRDTSRQAAPLTKRVFAKKSVLTVPTVQAKIDAQVAGLGVGFLPRLRALPYLQTGQLVAVPCALDRESSSLHVAWKTNNKGNALRWFVERLRDYPLG